MKKSLVALAVLAVSGAAFAQSSVTLFGVVDATVRIANGSASDKTELTNSSNTSSRLGFRGTEDLGGGLNASFWLEAGLSNDNGAGALATGQTSTNNQGASGLTGGGGLTFNRRSTVSLSGAFGEVRLGRDYTPQFWNQTVFDPFGTNGIGSTLAQNVLAGPAGVRASNSVGYFLPKMGGIYGQAQVYMGENASNSVVTGTTVNNKKDGNGAAFRIGYAAGPINVAFGYGETKFVTVTGTPGTGNIKSTNVGGSYDFGVAKLTGSYAQDDNSGVIADGKGYTLGVIAPMGAGAIQASYSTYELDTATSPKTNKLALGYVHNLSKRTALYTTLARLTNSNGASVGLGGATNNVNGSATGLDIGVKHSF